MSRILMECMRCVTVVACLWMCVSGESVVLSNGAVWPKPAEQLFFNDTYTIDWNAFDIIVNPKNQATCILIKKVIERFKESVKVLEDIAAKKRSEDRGNVLKNAQLVLVGRAGVRNLTSDAPILRRKNAQKRLLKSLTLNINEKCNDSLYPYYRMNESYSLSVLYGSVTLTAEQVWGIITGMETFSQLFYLTNDYKEVLINSTYITDWPSYVHRGVLLDTARHYISVDNILKTLDAMAMNKLNVFHWHIVDDESFPYQSKALPELSAKGAFHPKFVYTETDIKTIVEHARVRGIRVIPEFDVPGHSGAFYLSHPEIIVRRCGSKTTPLNPILNRTYDLLGVLFNEVQDWFPDDHFHVGGDEILEQCWSINKRINKYREERKLSLASLISEFFTRAAAIIHRKKGAQTIVWEDVYLKRATFNTELNNTKVQVFWLNEVLGDTIQKKIETIYSKKFYMDNAEDSFFDFYGRDPRLKANEYVEDELLVDKYLIGGEVCVWSELVNDNNLFNRMWPRTSAVAEVLWSRPMWMPFMDGMSQDVVVRAEEQACRMRRRGLTFGPAFPGFCVTSENVLRRADSGFENGAGSLL